MQPNWNALEEKLAGAFPDRAVTDQGPRARHEVDQALATWKDRIEGLGLDINDETQIFAFIAGMCEFDAYLDVVLIESGYFDPIPRQVMTDAIYMALGNILGTLRPYIEAHVPPGSVGSGYASKQ